MLGPLRRAWYRARDSLWFLPGVFTVLAGALAILLVQIEKRGVFAVGDPEHWLVGGGAEGARGVLSAIAGGLITVTGVVFSVTVVALQLASSQYTPRVLRNFTADRSNQVVLGVFIGTFTYTLLVLRVIRSPEEGDPGFVPRLALAVAMVLALLSIAFLIYFINHAARSIQVSVILDRVARLTLEHVERLFPEPIGRGEAASAGPDALPPGEPARVGASEGGYLQDVDGRALFELGRRASLVIRMECRVGEFLLPGAPVASVWPAGDVDEEVARTIRGAFALGSERTPSQDVEFGIIEISDIAVKALSPGINDPTTALRCIDRLAEILLALGTRRPPEDVRTEEGVVHFVARHLEFDRALGLAFDQVRHFGADNPTIVKKLLDTLMRLSELVPEPRRGAVRAQIDRVLLDADESIGTRTGRTEVERVASETRR